MTDSIVKGTLDDYLSATYGGSANTSMANNMYGFNHRQTPSPIPLNKDRFGLTFFTRPQLNLHTDNIRNVRIFTPLLNKDSTSMQRIIRCLLDPRIQQGYPDYNSRLDCPLVDNDQAFIPILTNHIKSISGWPDLNLLTHDSKPGAYQESWSQVDSFIENYTAYDIDVTFRNSRGDPIMLLFYAWEQYMSRVFEGSLIPYADYIAENQIDYMTRIYRLVLDVNKTRVQKIAATGVSFPTSLPIGGYFDFSSDTPFNDSNNDVSIKFKCLGAQYQDDILIDEFNKTVRVFNTNMSDDKRPKEMTKIPYDLLTLFNHRGYPRIDTNTYELEWYVNSSFYSAKYNSFKSLGFINPYKT